MATFTSESKTDDKLKLQINCVNNFDYCENKVSWNAI